MALQIGRRKERNGWHMQAPTEGMQHEEEVVPALPGKAQSDGKSPRKKKKKITSSSLKKAPRKERESSKDKEKKERKEKKSKSSSIGRSKKRHTLAKSPTVRQHSVFYLFFCCVS